MEDVLLQLPFDGDYPVSLPYGATPDNPSLQDKFREWGIAGHHGLDFALPPGTPVVAAEGGQVVEAGDNGDWGLSITLDHSWGQSLYAHLSEVKVEVGQEVKQGTVIGLSGQSGAAFGPHLHFGIKPLGSDVGNGFLGFVDPAPFLSPVLSGTSVSPPPKPESPTTRREVPLDQVIDNVLRKRLSDLRTRALAARRQKKEAILKEITEIATTTLLTNRLVRERFRLSRQTASNYLRELTTTGRLSREHQGRSTIYVKS